MSSGTLTIQLLSEQDDGSWRVLVTAIHGQFCNVLAGCRTAGLSRFYSIMTHEGTTLNSSFVKGSDGFIGITDQSFDREDMLGQVTVTDEATTWIGSYGNAGSFSLRQVCRSVINELGFEPGEKFIGHMECTATEGSTAEGVSNFRRLELAIESVTVQTDGSIVLSATADFDTPTSAGQVRMTSSSFNPQSNCRDVLFTPVAVDPWIVFPTAGTPLRILSGHFLEGSIVFTGELSTDDRCTCQRGASTVTNSSTEAVCEAINLSQRDCVVAPDCPGAQRLESGAFVLPSKPEEDCSAFSLVRTCSEAQLCPEGWVRFSTRCYLPIAQRATYSEAERACRAHGGDVASIHSQAENDFVAGLVSDKQPWLGLQLNQLSEFEWQDRSPLLYLNWADGSPREEPETCVSINENGKWVDEACTDTRQYVCKNILFAVETSCACSGETDTNLHGGRCGFWSPSDAVSPFVMQFV